MKRIIINGANGYVASNFIRELLEMEYEVIALVRGTQKYSAEERMNDALTEIAGGQYIYNNLKIYNYSLLDEDFGLAEGQADKIFNKEADYFHFAASLKYDMKSREEIFKTNVGGLTNSLEVFTRYAQPGSRIFFISTAYSCGITPEPFKERFYDNEDISHFRNYYEQSKRFAENVVKTYVETKRITASIIRLSQVVGHNKTGVTATDYGIFDFARRIYSLAHRNPHKALRVKVDPAATQNLIPIDTVTGYLVRMLQLRELPVIFNLTARQPVRNEIILNSLSNLLPVRIIADKSLRQEEMNPYERIISIGMSFTGSYTNTDIHFETGNLDKLRLEERNEPTDQSVHRMLEYFINKISGKKKDNVYTTVS